METLHLPSTQYTPEVRWDPLRGILIMRGESYPENVLSFYAPILEQMRSALQDGKPAQLQVEMHITYYNSASAKAFHRIFQMLNNAASNGCLIKLLWHYDEEDDMARDLGRDIKDDFSFIHVELVPLVAA